VETAGVGAQRDLMRTPLRVFPSPEAIGDDVARRLLDRIEAARRADKPFLLGCPTGRTPRPIYGAMARLLAEKPHDLRHVVVVMMDEYLERTPSGFAYASSTNAWSCHHFVRVEILDQFHGLLSEESVWFPDPDDPSSYDRRIADAGGVDFFLLASGAGDGHVAFNPPLSDRRSRTRVLELSEQTRRDNLQTFPEFGALANVPTHGVSVGIDTIASAKAGAMVVWGSGKRLTLSRILGAEHYELDWPATVIHELTDREIISDEAAATPP
jgi:glucosamine-6-phosphate deaminase